VTAIRLLELSAKAKENGERYAILTATRAAESVERQPYRSKPAPGLASRHTFRTIFRVSPGEAVSMVGCHA